MYQMQKETARDAKECEINKNNALNALNAMPTQATKRASIRHRSRAIRFRLMSTLRPLPYEYCGGGGPLGDNG
jgi:hypothetical protein